MRQTFGAYEMLTAAYPGWTLTEIKQLSVREREHWLAHARWARDLRRR